MDRDYKDGFFGDDEVKVFVGPEVEHTPAFGKTTLFLATNQLTYVQIKELCDLHDCEAVYFGANRTYVNNIANQPLQIDRLLDDGLFVTIDYPYAMHDAVKERFTAVWQHERFVPFCSVIFSKSDEDTQLCFKIDDVDFKSTNPGVWTQSMSDFKKQAGYTDWSKYKQDKIVDVTKWIPNNKETVLS